MTKSPIHALDAAAAYAPLMQRVEEASGLHFPPQRLPQMIAATDRAMRKTGMTELEDYVTALECGRASIATLVEEVVVGETYFFREPEQFAFLREVVLPEIVARKPAPAPIRIWSAGCATGEEAYSLAIVLAESGLAERGRVVGTDISRESLRVAARAEYGRWSLRGPGADRARRHMNGTGDALSVDPEVRKHVAFGPLNLARDLYPSEERGIVDFDLILCRNVLIYFDASTVAHVAGRLHESLAEGGWLVLASSDPPLAAHAPFQTVVTDRGVFYRKSGSVRPETSAAARASTAPPPSAPASRAVVDVATTPLAKASPSPIPPLVAASPEPPREAPSAASLNPEPHYLYALAEMEADHDVEALAALRRALYLAPDLVVAHLALGTVKQRLGDARGARRSFRSAQRLCAAMDKSALVPLSGGACAAHIESVARAQDATLRIPTNRRRRG